MSIRFLYLDLNSFFASCEQQDHPQFRKKPLAVIPMMAENTSVLAASYEAKAYGIKTGTKVKDAKKMCPGILFTTTHHSNYVRYHHQILDACDEILPIHSVCSIDEVCFELTGSQLHLEKAIFLAEKLKANISQKVGECLTSSIGIAPNILLAKMASDMQKPNGLTVISQKELYEKVSSLKLRDIPGVGAKMEARFHSQGIHSMKQLLDLNEKQMRALWGGIVGAKYYHLLKGVYIPAARISSKSIGHEHVLPPKERNLLDAQKVLQKLLSKAAIRLRKSEKMCRRLGFRIKFMSGEEFSREIKVPETQDTSFLIEQMLKSIRNLRISARPIKTGVVLSDFIDGKEHQLSFFTNERKNLLYKAVDKINARFGKETIALASVFEKKSSAQTAIAFSRIPELDEL